MAKQGRTTLEIGGVTIPVTVTLERRNGYRFSFVKTGLSMRIPHTSTQADFDDIFGKMKAWVWEVYQKKPDAIHQFAPRGYQSGDVLEVSGRRYTLQVDEATRQTSSARLEKGVIHITLNDRYDDTTREKAVKTLLSRVVAQDFYPEISRRVLDWNDRTFRQPIRSINLKYNHSNWGSCSSANNVNLSTKLLLTPQPIQDYVIVHELAHLLEMNHSPRFWALVEQHLPDYKVRRKWLRDNQSTCDF
jgi:predicted metal-dependent hydrolase